jgi:integrase
LGVALTTVRWQITQLGWRTVQGVPKSDAGDRTIALDTVTVTDIRRHRREQDRERENAGDAWSDSEFEFADEHGGPLHPADVTYAFHMIAYIAGLPPVRLHDLRHGAATLLQGRGVASDATLRIGREDGAVRAAAPDPAGRCA